MKKGEKSTQSCRLGAVGGSAVLEGVMMKGKDSYAVAVRSEAGDIHVVKSPYQSVRNRHKWLNIPLLRGVVGFVESMALSLKTLNYSAMIYSTVEQTQDGKTEQKPLSAAVLNTVMVIASVLAMVLALFLFQYAPAKLTSLLDGRLTGNRYVLNIIEGGIKVLLLLGYLLAVSAMKDIRRTFQYHGAEHKSIFCYEAGQELTVENVKKHRRFHPRCGTSFLFVMVFIGILVSCLPFVTWESTLARVGYKLLLLPVIMGLGYEFLMLTGKHPNALTRILSAPGMWVQRLTTREPDDAQIEVAIVALKCALPDVFGQDVPENAILTDPATFGKEKTAVQEDDSHTKENTQ